MDFKSNMQTASEIIEGTYSEYDEQTTVIIVPVDDHRFQTIFAHDEGDDGIKFNTKSCDGIAEFPYRELLLENSKMKYGRIEIEGDTLYVTGRALKGSDAGGISRLLLEVGKVADNWEFKLTGQDVN
jgi:hypothetical protein